MAVQGVIGYAGSVITFASPVSIGVTMPANTYPNGSVSFDNIADGAAYWRNNSPDYNRTIELYLCDSEGNNRVWLFTVALGPNGSNTTIKNANISGATGLVGKALYLIATGDASVVELRRQTTITLDTAYYQFHIAKNATTNGSFTVDKEYAIPGETVTITASPNSGYKANTPTGSPAVTMSSAGTNKWSFTMPASDVTITQGFSKINYTLSRVASPNTGGTVTLSKNTAQIGDEITITATPATGYRVKSISTNPSRTITNNKFTMPAGNVTVTVVFEKISYTVSKTVTPAAGGTASINKTSATMGEEITVTATPATGYKLKSITTSPARTVTNNKFTMPASAVTVTVTFEKINYTITKSSNPAAGGTVTTNKTTANHGDTVTVSQTPATGYYFDGWTKTPSNLAISNGAFTMPAQNVVLVANYLKRSTASVNTKSLTSNGTVKLTISPDKAEYRHKYRLNFGTGMDTGWVTVAANTTVIDIPVPDSWADAIPNATSKSGGTLTVKTYKSNNSTEIGSYEITGLIFNVRAGIVPTLSDITKSIVRTINGTTYANVGDYYVQSKCGVRIQATAAGVRSSTITKIECWLSGYSSDNYKKTVNNNTSLDFTTGLLSVKGSTTITVKATDSRGRTTTKTTTITVSAYSKPSGTLDVWRVDSGGTADTFGTYAKYTKTNKYTQIGNNALTVSLKSQNVTVSGPANSGNLLPTSRQTFDRMTEYNIQLILTDSFETVTITAKLPTALFIYHVNKDGDRLAFMKAVNGSRSKNGKDYVLEFSDDAQIYIGSVMLENYIINQINKRTMQQAVFKELTDSGSASTSVISSYPTTPGVYRVGSPIAGIPTGTNGYGPLIIFDAGSYVAHIYIDANGSFFYGRTTSSTIAPPSTWYKLTGTEVTPRT